MGHSKFQSCALPQKGRCQLSYVLKSNSSLLQADRFSHNQVSCRLTNLCFDETKVRGERRGTAPLILV